MLVLYRRHAIMLSVVLALGWLSGAAMVLVLGWLSGAAMVAETPITFDEPPAALPLELSAPPLQEAPDPHPPALALEIDVAPDPAVGETTTITLTVANAAPDPAEQLLVLLPTPDGTLALPGPGFVYPTQGWLWNLGHLEAYASATLTASLRLERLPRGRALLLRPQASAHGLTLPATAIGGAVVLPAERGPATARFTPGAAARLLSRDGRLQVDFPSHGFARPLTLRAALAAHSPAAPPALRHGLGALALEAFDDAGQDVHQFAAPVTLTIGYTTEQLQALRIAESALTLFWYDEAQRRWTPLPTTVDPATQTASAMVDHFSWYQLGNGASPSSAFIPSLQGWQFSRTDALGWLVKVEETNGDWRHWIRHA